MKSSLLNFGRLSLALQLVRPNCYNIGTIGRQFGKHCTALYKHYLIFGQLTSEKMRILPIVWKAGVEF